MPTIDPSSFVFRRGSPACTHARARTHAHALSHHTLQQPPQSVPSASILSLVLSLCAQTTVDTSGLVPSLDFLLYRGLLRIPAGDDTIRARATKFIGDAVRKMSETCEDGGEKSKSTIPPRRRATLNQPRPTHPQSSRRRPSSSCTRRFSHASATRTSR